jgi:hypothetical protein
MFGRLIYILTLALSVVAWPAETGTQLYLLGGTCLNLEGLVDYGAKAILCGASVSRANIQRR